MTIVHDGLSTALKKGLGISEKYACAWAPALTGGAYTPYGLSLPVEDGATCVDEDEDLLVCRDCT